MYFNYYYFIFMIPGILLSLWAQFKVKSTFSKYNKVATMGGLTGAQAARLILDRNNLQYVTIEQVAGNLTDHFDPKNDVVRLSEATFNHASVGAVGVAAHECGHAVQHARGYVPMQIRSAILPVTNIGSSLSVPLIAFGFIFSITGLVYAGIALFALVAIFQLVTLPVEFNASKRAIETLDASGMVSAEESKGVRKVLSAAALTYVASLITTLLQIAYYLTLTGRRRR